MPDVIRHPATGEPIALGPDEQLHRIGWPGAPVLVVTATRATARAPSWPTLTGWPWARHGRHHPPLASV